MAIKVFVLGRPGSGKSTAFRQMKMYAKKRYDWSVIHFNDYEILHEMFRVETLFQFNNRLRQFRPTQHGGFDVVDFPVLDTALKALEKEIRHRYSSKEELMVIEFARDDYVKALGKFSRDFLQDAYFLFIDADIDICIQRVHDRVAHRTTSDDLFVSEEIIRSYYSQQSMPSNLKIYGVDRERVKVINSSGSKWRFDEKVNQFVDLLFENETRATERDSRWEYARKLLQLANSGHKEIRTPALRTR